MPGDTSHTWACFSPNCMTFFEEYTKWALKIRLWELLLKWRDCQYLQSDAWAHPGSMWVHCIWMAEYMEHSLPFLCLMKNKMGKSLILLFGFIAFMFFPDAPKLGLDFSATTSNSRLSTMARTGPRLYETQSKREKERLFPQNVVGFCFSNLPFCLGC